MTSITHIVAITMLTVFCVATVGALVAAVAFGSGIALGYATIGAVLAYRRLRSWRARRAYNVAADHIPSVWADAVLNRDRAKPRRGENFGDAVHIPRINGVTRTPPSAPFQRQKSVEPSPEQDDRWWDAPPGP